MNSLSTLYELYLSHPNICTDTRSIVPGSLFFALKGDNFNANTFAGEAIAKGAAFAIVDDPNYVEKNCILVDDVLVALQDLARFHRSKITIPVIGLTGSNGKTTSKELIRAVLEQKFKTFATKGNLNNHIGVPLSILSLRGDEEIAVIEMGANHQKEIQFLCGIAKPTHGVITNVGLAHLEGFGGFEGVKKGKGELYAYLKENNGLAFINRDNHHLLEMAGMYGLKDVLYYGSGQENAVSAELLETDPFLSVKWSDGSEAFLTKVNLTGTYNFENVLAAICIGRYFGVEAGAVSAGLSGYHPTNNRSQLNKTEFNSVICDFYNANPSSMSAALNNLNSLVSSHKTVILGDMFELGEESSRQHEDIVGLANGFDFDEQIFIGDHFSAFENKYQGKFFRSRDEALEYLQRNPIKESLVLLKGSRGMALEKLLSAL